MKKLLLSFCASIFIAMACSAQTTKIMDSQIILGSDPTLIVYLTTDGSDCISLQAEIGSTPGSNNLFNQTYSGGALVIDDENAISVSLGSLSGGEHYVTLHLTLDDSSVAVMEYKAN